MYIFDGLFRQYLFPISYWLFVISHLTHEAHYLNISPVDLYIGHTGFRYLGVTKRALPVSFTGSPAFTDTLYRLLARIVPL